MTSNAHTVTNCTYIYLHRRQNKSERNLLAKGCHISLALPQVELPQLTYISGPKYGTELTFRLNMQEHTRT